VLPFANLSADKDNEYFSDGLTEEIINALSHVSGLKVIARTSAFAFKEKDEDVRRIAQTLGVGNVLDGSVRRAGNRIRVMAQLVAASDGAHIWSERYDRELADVFAIQDDIACQIASALEMKLAARRTALQRHTPSVAAYESYLKARFHFEKLTADALPAFHQHIQAALDVDPQFALAHTLLGMYFLQAALVGGESAHDVMPKARAAALRALEIDASLSDARAVLGAVAALYQYDWTEAGRQFALATAREPLPPLVRQFYEYFYLLGIGQPLASIDQHRRALEEDPLNVRVRFGLAVSLGAAGRSEDAAIELRTILEIDARFPYAHMALAALDAANDELDEALARIERVFGSDTVIASDEPAARTSAVPRVRSFFRAFAPAALAGLLTRRGQADRAAPYVSWLNADARVNHVLRAVFYMWSNDLDRAADAVTLASPDRPPFVYFLLFALTVPNGKALRASARWPAIAKAMNLPG